MCAPRRLWSACYSQPHLRPKQPRFSAFRSRRLEYHRNHAESVRSDCSVEGGNPAIAAIGAFPKGPTSGDQPKADSARAAAGAFMGLRPSKNDPSTVLSGPNTSARPWRLRPHLPRVPKVLLILSASPMLGTAAIASNAAFAFGPRLLLRALASVVLLLASMVVPLLAFVAVRSLAPSLVVIPRWLWRSSSRWLRRACCPRRPRWSFWSGSTRWSFEFPSRQHLRPLRLWRPRCGLCLRRRCRLRLRRCFPLPYGASRSYSSDDCY